MSIQSEIERIKNEKYSIVEGGGSFTIPEGVKIIRQYAFYEANFDQPLILPDTIEEINYHSFYLCGGVINIPRNIKRLKARAFRQAGLGVYQDITELPSTLEEIGELCFLNQGSQGFKITKIPASVKTIGARAFEGCSGLTSITFEGTPESIGDGIFNTCPNLTEINVPWSADHETHSSIVWGVDATINYNYTGE